MEELIHVPLLLRVPGVLKRVMNNGPFSLIHLAPTILDCAQLQIPVEFQGRSHKSELQNEGRADGVAISESVGVCSNPMRRENRLGARVLSIRESRFKLLLHFETKADYLYDLGDDPCERHPIAPTEEKAVRRRLLEIARTHLHRSQRDRNLKFRLQMRLRDLRIEWQIPAGKASATAS
jgi:arylsulfatase A-like enzyme